MDCIVYVMREGTTVEFDTTFIKDKTHREIAAVDPGSLTVADVRALLAQREAERRAENASANPGQAASAAAADGEHRKDAGEGAAA